MTVRRAALAVLFTGSLVAYGLTLAPGWGAESVFNTWDGLEYVLASQLWGIDHPSGHPLYLLLQRLFVAVVPWGDLGQRAAALSSVLGAAAAVAVFLVVERALRLLKWSAARPTLTTLASFSAGATLAFSRVFWSHAVIIEIHTLLLLVISLLLLQVLGYLEHRSRRRLFSCALLCGVLLATSLMAALTVIGPAVLVLLLVGPSERSRRAWLLELAGGAGFALLGAAAYLYYPAVIARGPGFVQPVSVNPALAFGSWGWMSWFLQGAAWTDAGMLRLGRVVSTAPNYFRQLLANFGWPAMLLFAAAVGWGLRHTARHLRLARRERWNLAQVLSRFPAGGWCFWLLLGCFLSVALSELAVQEVSSGAAIMAYYISNFFLPSFLLFLVLAAVGGAGLVEVALRWLERREGGASLARAAAAGLPAGEGRRAALLLKVLLWGIALAPPLALVGENAAACDLSGDRTVYTSARAAMGALPQGAVVYSKLVHLQLGAWFAQVEPVLAGREIKLVDYRLAKAKETARSPGISSNRAMAEALLAQVAQGQRVFLSGDCVDRDKWPEPLVVAALELSPLPAPLDLGPRRRLRPELLLYEVLGPRKGEPVELASLPALERAIGDAHRFGGVLELVGFRPRPDAVWSPGRDLALDVYWKSLADLPAGMLGEWILLDESQRRLEPAGPNALFSIGGTVSLKAGETVREVLHYLLPEVPPGRYFLGLGVRSPDGSPLPLQAKPGDGGSGPGFVVLTPLQL